MPEAFPLEWPEGRKRTSSVFRRNGQFKSNDRDIRRGEAIQRVRREVELLGGTYIVTSTDVPLRQKDGMPYIGRSEEPGDPGAAVYFAFKGRQYVLACDTFHRLAQNIAAIASHIEATRRIERYGVATASDTLQAFVALPSPKKPHEILGVPANADTATVQRAWREKVARHHPDRGGTHAAVAEVNAARDAMLKARA